MPQATFDGVNLKVNIPSTGDSTITMDAQEDFYEPWKDFLHQGTVAGNMNNKRFPQVFRPVAGDDIVPGIFKYAGMFFLRNDLGWRFQLPDENVTLVLTGNMTLQDTSLPFFTARAGRTGSILGLANFVTNVEPLERILRNKHVLDPSTGVETIYATDGVTVLFTRNVYEDAAGAVPYDGTDAPHRVERFE